MRLTHWLAFENIELGASGLTSKDDAIWQKLLAMADFGAAIVNGHPEFTDWLALGKSFGITQEVFYPKISSVSFKILFSFSI
jgi:hypothetical protein